MKKHVHVTGRGTETSFYELDDGHVLVQDGRSYPENYVMKDNIPLNPKEIVQYLKKKAGFSVKDLLFHQLKTNESSLFHIKPDKIYISDNLVEKLRKTDLKECFEYGKLYSGFGDQEIFLGEISSNIKEFSSPDPHDILRESEYQPEFTLEEMISNAKEKYEFYGDFLKAVKAI
jgi:hypothetical protein